MPRDVEYHSQRVERKNGVSPEKIFRSQHSQLTLCRLPLQCSLAKMQNSNSFQQLRMSLTNTIFLPLGAQHPSCRIEMHSAKYKAAKETNFGLKRHAFVSKDQ